MNIQISKFVLSFENNAYRTSYKQYVFLTVTIKDYNVTMDGKNVFVQIEEHMITS